MFVYNNITCTTKSQDYNFDILNIKRKGKSRSLYWYHRRRICQEHHMLRWFGCRKVGSCCRRQDVLWSCRIDKSLASCSPIWDPCNILPMATHSTFSSNFERCQGSLTCTLDPLLALAAFAVPPSTEVRS